MYDEFLLLKKTIRKLRGSSLFNFFVGKRHIGFNMRVTAFRNLTLARQTPTSFHHRHLVATASTPATSTLLLGTCYKKRFIIRVKVQFWLGCRDYFEDPVFKCHVLFQLKFVPETKQSMFQPLLQQINIVFCYTGWFKDSIFMFFFWYPFR